MRTSHSYAASRVACAIIFFALAGLCYSGAFAQGTYTEKITKIPYAQNASYSGIDGYAMWFAFPSVAPTSPNPQYGSFVSSTKFVSVTLPGQKTAAPSYDAAIPATFAMTSSGIREKKAIHVISPTPSRATMTILKERARLIPVEGWGTEYYIAGGTALPGALDEPVGFSVVANMNATILTITTTCDIRANKAPLTILHAAGSTFRDTLNRGDAIQYLSLLSATDSNSFAGSHITCSNPVGVFSFSTNQSSTSGTAKSPTIEMLPPVGAWGNEYAATTIRGSLMVIGTKDGQTITYNFKSVLVNKGEAKIIYDQIATTWKSNSPFMLATLESDEIRDTLLRPTLLIHAPTSTYTKELIVDISRSNPDGYMTVVLPYDANLFVNGWPVNFFNEDSEQPMSGGYKLWTVHRGYDTIHVISDKVLWTTMGAYDNRLALTGEYLSARDLSGDTASPEVSFSGECERQVTIKDASGVRTIIWEVSAGHEINMVLYPILDSTANYSFKPSEDQQYNRYRITDKAGNVTIVEHTFTREAVEEDVTIDTIYTKPGAEVTRSYSLRNVGTIPAGEYDLTLLGKPSANFSLSSSKTDSIPVGEATNITVLIHPQTTGVFRDSVQYQHCNRVGSIVLVVIVDDTGLVVSPIEFGNVPVGSISTRNFTVVNKSMFPEKITSITLSSGEPFRIRGLNLPSTLPGGILQTFEAQFEPRTLGDFTAIVTATSSNTTGTAIFHGASAKNGVAEKQAITIRYDASRGVFSVSANAEAKLSLYDILGRAVLEAPVPLGQSEIALPANLIRSTYLYQLTAKQGEPPVRGSIQY